MRGSRVSFDMPSGGRVRGGKCYATLCFSELDGKARK